MRRCLSRRSGQRGVALLLVLWACTLLAILLGGYAALARTEGLQARYDFAQTQAHYAAEAGVMRAVYGLQDPQAKQRWIGDGRTYTFHYGDATVLLSSVDEGGKVDLNTASPEVLQALFQAAGMPQAQAQILAGRVVDWRNPVNLVGAADSGREAYAAAGRDYGPRNAPFASVEELQMVLGMTPALYRQLAGVITIWSGSTSPDPDMAPPLALAAIPGMTTQQREAIEAARIKHANDPSLILNNGTTHSIRSEATLADGTRAVLRVTVRLQSGQAQSYAVLRWREGTAE
ncbi:general secretion pathway protein GspK [Rhodanobacter sp. T12-5]|nr:type II secretion system protein GspK [Rhodanobacter sp. T12-5]KAA0069296.1 general secretion pathway protein GspK [Rhodanobacter sp. T12-5]